MPGVLSCRQANLLTIAYRHTGFVRFTQLPIPYEPLPAGLCDMLSNLASFPEFARLNSGFVTDIYSNGNARADFEDQNLYHSQSAFSFQDVRDRRPGVSLDFLNTPLPLLDELERQSNKRYKRALAVCKEYMSNDSPKKHRRLRAERGARVTSNSQATGEPMTTLVTGMFTPPVHMLPGYHQGKDGIWFRDAT